MKIREMVCVTHAFNSFLSQACLIGKWENATCKHLQILNCSFISLSGRNSNARNMGKKGSWFSAIKRVFSPHSKEKVVNVRQQWLSFSVSNGVLLNYFTICLDFSNKQMIQRLTFCFNFDLYEIFFPKFKLLCTPHQIPLLA